MRQTLDTLQRRADLLDSQSDASVQSFSVGPTGRVPAWLEQATAKPRELEFRDLRADLEVRAKSLDEHIKSAHEQLDLTIQQLEQEHAIRIEPLKIELDTVKKVLEIEERRIQGSSDSESDSDGAVSELILTNGESALPPVQE